MNQLDLFADAPVHEPVTGSILAAVAPKPPRPGFIEEVLENTQVCWPSWKPIIGDGIFGLVESGSCGIKTIEGESTYGYGMPMRITSIDIEKRRMIATGNYDPIVNSWLAEQHNDREYILEAMDVWPPCEKINQVEDFFRAGCPQGWFPPHPFKTWREAVPRAWRDEYDQFVADNPCQFAKGDYSCLWCQSFWNAKHSNGGYCTCQNDDKLFGKKSMQARFPHWKPKRKTRRAK